MRDQHFSGRNRQRTAKRVVVLRIQNFNACRLVAARTHRCGQFRFDKYVIVFTQMCFRH
ncbi:hypothetical protein Barb7_03094 [Bacteroidales bacterium Barb7]|nr:hypothetical protein Barb7_03094 [Bacteroidales bacterium Barb7]